jgi:hypothetical protein
MKRQVTTIVWICAVVCVSMCAAQETKQPEAKELNERRMSLMGKRVEALSAMGPKEEKLQFSEKPLLRYNDPARDIVDATVWGLGRKGRPHAVLVFEVYGGQFVQYELTAVADPPRSVKTTAFQWAPQATPFIWSKIPDQAPPHARESIRRQQIKQAAQEFSASEEWRGQTYQLRMMPQPILQYEDKEQGVISGAVFVWAHGTNVEVLMFVEARREEGASNRWVAGFSRLAAASLDVDYKGQDFWNSPQNVTANQTSPYFFQTDPVTEDEREAFAPQ